MIPRLGATLFLSALLCLACTRWHLWDWVGPFCLGIVVWNLTKFFWENFVE